MDEKTLDKISHQIVFVLTTIWGVFFIPICIMIILISQGVSSLPTNNVAIANILYYNLLSFPVMLLISGMFSWAALKQQKYRLAIALSLLPLLNILIEFIAADLALYFS